MLVSQVPKSVGDAKTKADDGLNDLVIPYLATERNNSQLQSKQQLQESNQAQQK